MSNDNRTNKRINGYTYIDTKQFESEDEIKAFLQFAGATNPEAIYTARFKYPARNLNLPPFKVSQVVEQTIAEYGNKIVLLFSPEEIQWYPYPNTVKLAFPAEWQMAEHFAKIVYKLDENTPAPKLVAIMHPYNYITREFITDFFEIEAAQNYLNRLLYKLKETKKEGKFYVIAKKKLIAEV